MTRKELYNYIKKYKLSAEVYSTLGKNFTNCSNAELLSIYERNKQLEIKNHPNVFLYKEQFSADTLRGNLLNTLYDCFNNDVINTDQFNSIRGILDTPDYSKEDNDAYVSVEDYNALEDKYEELLNSVSAMIYSINNDSVVDDIQAQIGYYKNLVGEVE